MTAAAAQLERPFSPVHLAHTEWKRLFSESLNELAGDKALSEKDRHWSLVHAARVRDCGVRALVQRCRCGAAIPRSVHALPGPGGYCETRGCPVCSRRRSAKLAGIAERAARAVPAGSSWWLLTGTTRRDPYDPVECTVDALRARTRRCRAGMTALVKRLRKAGLTPLQVWCGTELAGNGHIHAHTLIALAPGALDPAADETDLDRQCARLEELIRAAGFDEMADARPADPSHVLEVVKYQIKAPSWEKSLDPDEDAQRFVHPTLAARFAVATRGIRLLERYAGARQIKMDDRAELEAERDAAEAGAQEGRPAAEAAVAAFVALEAAVEPRQLPPEPCPCCGSRADDDRWWVQGRAERVAAWARRTWDGRPGLRLCGPWPRHGPRKTAVATWAPELFPGPAMGNKEGKEPGFSVDLVGDCEY